nr:hypothetical protein CFP56_14534 [Quercus suber]
MGEWVMTERGLCNMVHGCEGNQEDDMGIIVKETTKRGAPMRSPKGRVDVRRKAEVTRVNPDEKQGWRDREASQMKAFRETRTLVRLDRMIANESWKEEFPNMIVHHVSMAASDHRLLVLRPKGSKPHGEQAGVSSLK